MTTRVRILQRIRVILAGRAAEEVRANQGREGGGGCAHYAESMDKYGWLMSELS